MHSSIKRNVLQHKINTKKTKAGLSRLLRHLTWKRSGFFLKQLRRKQVRKKWRKKTSGEAYDIKKQTIFKIKNGIKGALRLGAHTGLAKAEMTPETMLNIQLGCPDLVPQWDECNWSKVTEVRPGWDVHWRWTYSWSTPADQWTAQLDWS